jgi:hypothetical protein
LGPGDVSLVLYGLSCLAGGTTATVTAVTELSRLRLTVDLFMILAAGGAGLPGHWGDESTLTGESEPVSKPVGSMVFAFGVIGLLVLSSFFGSPL